MQQIVGRFRPVAVLSLAILTGFGAAVSMAMETRAVQAAAGETRHALPSPRTELGSTAIVQDESLDAVGTKRADAHLAEYLEMHGRAERGLSGRAAMMPWTSLRSATN
jgi:hypothetical protein